MRCQRCCPGQQISSESVEGVIFSITAIVPPQCGQSQPHEVLGSEVAGVVERVKGPASRNCLQRGKSSWRRRLATSATGPV